MSWHSLQREFLLMLFSFTKLSENTLCKVNMLYAIAFFVVDITCTFFFSSTHYNRILIFLPPNHPQQTTSPILPLSPAHHHLLKWLPYLQRSSLILSFFLFLAFVSSCSAYFPMVHSCQPSLPSSPPQSAPTLPILSPFHGYLPL